MLLFARPWGHRWGHAPYAGGDSDVFERVWAVLSRLELAALIETSVRSPLVLTGKLQGTLAPGLDVAPELFVASVVELELVSSQSAELSEHVSEDGRAEAEVLLGCEPAESVETVARLDRHQVDEVAGLGAAEHGEHLVDGELLTGEHRSWPPGFGREEPGVGGKVELGAIVGALDDHAGEARVVLYVADGEAGGAQGTVDRRNESVDGSSVETEEVEVTGSPLDIAARDQSGTAGEGEVRRLVEACDDLGNLLLKRAQHLSATAVASQPVAPRAPDWWR